MSGIIDEDTEGFVSDLCIREVFARQQGQKAHPSAAVAEALRSHRRGASPFLLP